MFKKWMLGAMAASVLALALAGFYGVTPTLAAGGPGGRGPVATGSGQLLTLPAASDLNDDEAAGLLWMYEEEKLARDVYTALEAQWGAAVFSNIALSEQKHMDAIQVLLDRYTLSVPANPAGVFTNPSLQALYTSLVERGGQSLTAALQVGVDIENLDIADLDQRLAQTDNGDLQQVYANLRSGSTNHLRAFTGSGGGQPAARTHAAGRGGRP